jgi:uncharacterized coiled-coil DUF342 family protein
MANETEQQETTEAANDPSKKYPELAQMRDRLQEEEKVLLAKSSSLRKQREELLSRVQPLENKLREVNKALIAIEQPRLAEIKTQLGRLAVAMGGRAMNQPPPA